MIEFGHGPLVADASGPDARLPIRNWTENPWDIATHVPFMTCLKPLIHPQLFHSPGWSPQSVYSVPRLVAQCLLLMAYSWDFTKRIKALTSIGVATDPDWASPLTGRSARCFCWILAGNQWLWWMVSGWFGTFSSLLCASATCEC